MLLFLMLQLKNTKKIRPPRILWMASISTSDYMIIRVTTYIFFLILRFIYYTNNISECQLRKLMRKQKQSVELRSRFQKITKWV